MAYIRRTHANYIVEIIRRCLVPRRIRVTAYGYFDLGIRKKAFKRWSVVAYFSAEERRSPQSRQPRVATLIVARVHAWPSYIGP